MCGYDYSKPNLYFITICTKNRKYLFGDIIELENEQYIMDLNEMGKLIEWHWFQIPIHFTYVKLQEFVIMQNQIHGIIEIMDDNVWARHVVPILKQQINEKYGNPTKNSIPTIIRSFKGAVSRKLNRIYKTSRKTICQRNYYEHIIRNDKSYQNICDFIWNNPTRWEFDKYYR